MAILSENRHISSFIQHVPHANSPFSSPAIEIPLGIYTGYNSFHRRTPSANPFHLPEKMNNILLISFDK